MIVKIENRKKKSLVAQRMMKDHTRALYDGEIGDTRKFEISKKLILSSRNSAHGLESLKTVAINNCNDFIPYYSKNYSVDSY